MEGWLKSYSFSLERRRKVITDRWIVGTQSQDELYLFARYFGWRRSVRRPEYLFRYCESLTLLWCKIRRDQFCFRASEIGEAVGTVLTDINFSVRVGDLVDDASAHILKKRVAVRCGCLINIEYADQDILARVNHDFSKFIFRIKNLLKVFVRVQLQFTDLLSRPSTDAVSSLLPFT